MGYLIFERVWMNCITLQDHAGCVSVGDLKSSEQYGNRSINVFIQRIHMYFVYITTVPCQTHNSVISNRRWRDTGRWGGRSYWWFKRRQTDSNARGRALPPSSPSPPFVQIFLYSTLYTYLACINLYARVYMFVCVCLLCMRYVIVCRLVRWLC